MSDVVTKHNPVIRNPLCVQVREDNNNAWITRRYLFVTLSPPQQLLRASK
jgi:hypothetical protein